MKDCLIYPLMLLLMLSTVGVAQEDIQITKKDSVIISSWIIGEGINAIDDSGNVFNGLFNIKTEWNIVPYPSRLSIGRYLKNGLGIEAIASYNQYKEGKIVDGLENQEVIDYVSVDARLSYDLNKIIGQTGWFDPYVGIGLGYTNANNLERGTYNAIVGFRTWFSDRWGLDFSSTGKWSIGSENGVTNHLQHAAGVVYQFGIEKGLSKSGEEKMELIAAIEKEKQRQQDSINEVNREKEALLLAERLAKEKEKAKLAAAEDAKLKAESDRKISIEKRIAALGYVYFDLNSSFINKKSKSILDSLTVILKEIPELKLKVTSHTDSRGDSKYNDWLSERRVKSTKDYLVANGVAESKLTTESFGERQLLNECDDDTYCAEEKHKINRRSEFIIIQY